MFSLGDELCGGFFYEVAFFNLVLSVDGMAEPAGLPRASQDLRYREH